MLNITEAQMTLFRADSHGASLARLEAFILDGFAEEATALPPPGLRQFVEAGIERAKAHGIIHEQGVGLFLVLALLYGPDFSGTPEQAQIQHFLSLDVDGRIKMDWISDHMIAAENHAA